MTRAARQTSSSPLCTQGSSSMATSTRVHDAKRQSYLHLCIDFSVDLECVERFQDDVVIVGT